MRTPTLLLALVSTLALALGACDKGDKKSAGKAPDPQGTVGADGVRRVAVQAGKGGYKPDKIPGKPGEKLILVFTRTAEGECLSQIKVGDGKVHDLPMNTPYEIEVTIPPAGGDVRFACGMDMYSGTIVVN